MQSLLSDPLPRANGVISLRFHGHEVLTQTQGDQSYSLGSEGTGTWMRLFTGRVQLYPNLDELTKPSDKKRLLWSRKRSYPRKQNTTSETRLPSLHPNIGGGRRYARARGTKKYIYDDFRNFHPVCWWIPTSLRMPENRVKNHDVKSSNCAG